MRNVRPLPWKFWGSLALLSSLALGSCQGTRPFTLPVGRSFSSQTTATPQTPMPQAIPGEIVVRLNTGIKPEEYAQRHGLHFKEALGLQMYVFQSDGPVAFNILTQDPHTQWAEPNYTLSLPPLSGREPQPPTSGVQARSAVPNDPLLPAQYGFSITGMEQVWQQHPGRPEVVVAVIDSGIDGSHPEFQGQLVEGFDFTLKTPAPGGHVDGYGHGTHVAGVIGALSNNGQGIAGIAPGCKLMPVRIFNNWGQSESGRSAKAVIWAVDQGAKVINASWGSPMLGEASKAAYEYALAKDVVFVAAVGNAGNEEPKYPGAVPEAIGVAATNADDRWGSFSTFGEWVDLGAPGAGILSTYPLNKGNGYRIMDGTSMAAPFVSAAAALLRSQHPDWNVTQVRQRLESTAKDVIMAGKDKYSGYGRVDIAAALNNER